MPPWPCPTTIQGSAEGAAADGRLDCGCFCCSLLRRARLGLTSALCRPLAFSTAAVVGLRPRRRSRAEVSRRDSAPPARGVVVVRRGSLLVCSPDGVESQGRC